MFVRSITQNASFCQFASFSYEKLAECATFSKEKVAKRVVNPCRYASVYPGGFGGYRSLGVILPKVRSSSVRESA